MVTRSRIRLKAKHLAREAVRNELNKQGMSISLVDAQALGKAAGEYLKAHNKLYLIAYNILRRKANAPVGRVHS